MTARRSCSEHEPPASTGLRFSLLVPTSCSNFVLLPDFACRPGPGRGGPVKFKVKRLFFVQGSRRGMVGFLRAAMPSSCGGLKHGARSLVTQLASHPTARPVAAAGARNTAGAPGARSQGNSGAPPWRQPRGRSMVSLVNPHTNATIIGWHLWQIDLKFAPGLPAGWGMPRMSAVPWATRLPARCGAAAAGRRPGGNPGANLKSICHRCYLEEVASVRELTKETIVLPLGCLQGGLMPSSGPVPFCSPSESLA